MFFCKVRYQIKGLYVYAWVRERVYLIGGKGASESSSFYPSTLTIRQFGMLNLCFIYFSQAANPHHLKTKMKHHGVCFSTASIQKWLSESDFNIQDTEGVRNLSDRSLIPPCVCTHVCLCVWVCLCTSHFFSFYSYWFNGYLLMFILSILVMTLIHLVISWVTSQIPDIFQAQWRNLTSASACFLSLDNIDLSNTNLHFPSFKQSFSSHDILYSSFQTYSVLFCIEKLSILQ